MYILIALILVWTAYCFVFIRHYNRDLASLWREPVFRRPILCVESDDWGPGPPEQAQILRRLEKMLSGFKDQLGNPAVMTLGVILSIPKPRADNENAAYEHGTLAGDEFSELRAAMISGRDSGAFSLQLHGMEHFWPPALLAHAARDEKIRNWLAGEYPETEELPPALQSRWIDCSKLPSSPIASSEIDRAAAEETGLFKEIFGGPPLVAVPPTFVWDERVERAWARSGVRAVITPGKRFTARDERGDLISEGPRHYTGDKSSSGLTYFVRDNYFEPIKGHTFERGLAALERNTRLGRMTLLETHRLNFTDADGSERSFEMLGELFVQSIKAFPDVLFLCPEKILARMADGDAGVLETSGIKRLERFLARIESRPGFRTFYAVSGLFAARALLKGIITLLGHNNR